MHLWLWHFGAKISPFFTERRFYSLAKCFLYVLHFHPLLRIQISFHMYLWVFFLHAIAASSFSIASISVRAAPLAFNTSCSISTFNLIVEDDEAELPHCDEDLLLAPPTSDVQLVLPAHQKWVRLEVDLHHSVEAQLHHPNQIILSYW